MSPPMLHNNLNFFGILDFCVLQTWFHYCLHPLVAQTPANQLPSIDTFKHAPSPLIRQCNVHEGVTRDLLVVGVGPKSEKKLSKNMLV